MRKLFGVAVMDLSAKRSIIPGFIGFLVAAVLLAGSVFLLIGRLHTELGNLPGQVNKVAEVSELDRDLLAQVYFAEGYMLNRDPACLEEFSRYTSANTERLQELHRAVRQSRKPVVEMILNCQQAYTRLWESEIIPLIQRGDAAGAFRIVQSGEATSLVEQAAGRGGRPFRKGGLLRRRPGTGH
jgi:CHASE3 domain sensor protein